MDTSNGVQSILEDIDQQLDVPNQVWLFGAGISFKAGIPLMHPLTQRVEQMLASKHPCFGQANIDVGRKLVASIRGLLKANHHVEHVLSYLGDLISLADHQAQQTVNIGSETVSIDTLRSTHRLILLAVRHTVEFGYIPKTGGGEDTVGEPGSPCVSQDGHDSFVSALFRKRRAGQEHRPPVRFITTNYDTLLEDALAAAGVACVDGFAGGATGFWDPRNRDERLSHAQRVCRHTATICKLHGSVDWVAAAPGVVMRVRSSVIDPQDPEQTLLIYPQATKYQVTQRDPFASLFSDFRNALRLPNSTTLTICGYSFGDEHVNEEIELALRTGPETLSLLVLCRQNKVENGELAANQGFPDAVAEWIQNEKYRNRIRVLGSQGYYRGNLENRLESGREYDWWTFEGVTRLLAEGSEAVI